MSESTIIDAACDYVRLTFKPNAHGLEEVLFKTLELFDSQHDEGFKAKAVSLNGYKGAMCNGVFFGEGKQGAMFQVSGARAHNYVLSIRDIEMLANIPRFDLQVTVNAKGSKDYEPAEIRDAIRQIEASERQKNTRSLTLIETRKRTDTLYVGSRNSGAFIRCYNAGAVHRDVYPPEARRFEVQYNKATARTPFRAYANATSHTACATSLVVGKLMSVGLEFDFFQETIPMMPEKQHVKSDLQKKLDWVTTLVAPSVRELLKAGYNQQLADAFGVIALELKRETVIGGKSTEPDWVQKLLAE